MASDLHWFPFYGADWLGSTAVSMMLPEQEGAYLRLLVLAWGDGGDEPSLPADAFALAQMSRLGSRWKKLGALIVAQFEEKDGRLYNVKLSTVWQEQQLKHAKTVLKASMGGKAKADKLREKRAAAAAPSSASGTAPSSASAVPQAVLGECLEPATKAAWDVLEKLPIQNLESEGAVEQSPTDFVLPAPAPTGALALEGARAAGAVGRTAAQRNGHSNGAPNASAILAMRAAIGAEDRDRAQVVARWCEEHPADAEKLRTDLSREFCGDDAIVAKAREAAFESQVLRRVEVAHV